MRLFLSFLGFLLVSNVVVAQGDAELKLLSIEDVSTSSLAPRGLSQLKWVPKSDTYAYRDGDNIKMVDARSGKEINTIALDALNAALKAAGVDEVKRWPGLTWHTTQYFSFVNTKFVVSVQLGKTITAKIEQDLDPGQANLEYHLGTGITMSYTVGDDLFVNGERINQPDEQVVYGQAVHRYEFGISKGTFWSPNHQKLAFYKNNQSTVTDYPMLDITQPTAQAKTVKYPMAGAPNEVVRLGIYDTKSKQTVYMQTGDEDQYLTNITWGPAGKYIYIVIVSRGQDHLMCQKYDAGTGKLIKTLFEEKSDKFVEPLKPLHFNPVKPTEFVWATWRDGYTHLYTYNTSGKLIKQLTKGEFEVTDFHGFDPSGKAIFFSATKESPLENHLYKVSAKGGKIYKLSGHKGRHGIQVSEKSNYIIDSYSSRRVPYTTLLLDKRGKEVRTIHAAKNPMEGYAENGVEFGVIKANDGTTDLHYRIIKPHNFDPSKKYPTIVYVYGGSHAQMVKETWMGGASLFLHYMAQQGYIIFTVDNRGSDNRGAAFEQITHRQLGTIEMQDQLTGLEFIKSQHYVDSERLGVHGWSFGGFMTTSLMLRQPGAFKVGVCGGPVIDWSYYEIMYTERYMDTPQENPEGYKTSNLLNYVENLEGKLLIVHGADDDVVVWQHTLSFVDKCVGAGVLFDYFPYPGHKHHVYGKDRIHLQKNMAQYFIDHL